jgi:carbon storage regulator CsrA
MTMLVLSRRLNEKILFPGFDTTVKVVDIRSGIVRLGIEAPAEVRVLREEIPDRVAEWGPEPEPEFTENPPTLIRLNQMLKKRLEITRLGLCEFHAHVRAGHDEDADRTLASLNEDLDMLQRRVQREVERTSLLAPVPDIDEIPPCPQLVRRPK